MNQIHEHVWIADRQTVVRNSISHIDHVITVCQDGVEDNISSDTTYNQFSLADGETDKYKSGTCTYALFEDAANALYTALKNTEDNILIHCHAGQSRSSSVAIAAIARIRQDKFTPTFRDIKDNHPQTDPNITLRDLARKYINTYTPENRYVPNLDE